MAEILLPELGEGIENVEISDIMVSEGSNINKNEPMIVVESDKASMEIPIDISGTIEKIYIKKGDKISAGEPILSIKSNKKSVQNNQNIENIEKEQVEKDIVEENNGEKSAESTPKTIKHEKDNAISTQSPIGKGVLASPSVRRFARELGCDLKLVEGTANKGRISQEDVQNYIKGQLSKSLKAKPNLTFKAPGQDLDFSKWGKIETQPLNKIKRITGARLQQAWQAIPHVTQFDKADVTKLEQLRISLKKLNKDKKLKVSILPFIMKAVIKVLKEFPHFNSSLDENSENLVLKKYYHFGIAVDTEDGLIVPVMRDVDKKNIKAISSELVELSNKARNKKLLPNDLVGGTFTISSLGGIGGTFFTPIINPPEVAILGISKMQDEPVFLEEKFRKRKILPFSLSYDHRIIDGADAARFTSRLSDYLSNLDKLTEK